MNPSVGFHRSIPADLRDILDHYESESGAKLANEFNEELQSKLNTVRENPTFFPLYRGDIRRANLKRFPIIFSTKSASLRSGFSFSATTNEIQTTA